MHPGLERMVKEGMRVSSGERVLVVFDKPNKLVGGYLYEICGKLGAKVEHILITGKPAGEPTREMAEQMKKSDVVFLVSPGLSWTEAVRKARDAGARIGRVDVSTETMDALDVDYRAVQKSAEQLKKALDLGKTIRVTSDAGTDIEASIEGREAMMQDGVADHDGAFHNYPAGEVSIAPLEGTAEGEVVIDACLSGQGLLDAPIRVEFVKGRIRKISGYGEEKELGENLEECGIGGGRLGEISFGINPRGRLMGNIINDQKVLGTFHIATGTNVYIGGKIKSKCHIEGVGKGCRLFVDGKEVRLK